MLTILNQRAPYKKSGSWNDSPWITKDLKRSLRKQKRLYNNYKRFDLANDKQKYRKFRKMLNTKLRRAQDKYVGNTLDCDLKEKPKKFWSYIKSKRQDQVGVPPLFVNSSVKTDGRNPEHPFPTSICTRRPFIHATQSLQ